MRQHIDIFNCPSCRGDLIVTDHNVTCATCQNHYKVNNGIPLLYWPNDWDSDRKDVTDIVKDFYEKSPFPNYEEIDNIGSLVNKAERTFFANLLNKQVPFNIRVLEVGCGTGQMSNFLGVAQRYIFAADLCLNSLKLAQEFKKKNDLSNVGFYQTNLFKPIFKEESFPFVICNGVLHHTSDPYLGFQSISRLVKKGGYILIGLYNKYGRLITDIRRIVFQLSGNRFKSLDPRLRKEDRGEAKRSSWFFDQYKHPHESKHTIGEVLRWFDETGFEFVHGIPNLKAFHKFSLNEKIFKKVSRGNCFDHFITQTQLALNGSKEGGFYIMIGKRIK